MKPPNYLRNILLAFLLFFIGQLLIQTLGTLGTWVILGGVILFYIVWWRRYQTRDHSGKDKDP